MQVATYVEKLRRMIGLQATARKYFSRLHLWSCDLSGRLIFQGSLPGRFVIQTQAPSGSDRPTKTNMARRHAACAVYAAGLY